MTSNNTMHTTDIAGILRNDMIPRHVTEDHFLKKTLLGRHYSIWVRLGKYKLQIWIEKEDSQSQTNNTVSHMFCFPLTLPFEPQKSINFIFDIMIVIQSHHNSDIHIMPFLPCFVLLILTDVLNCTKVISKTKRKGL